MSPEPQDDFLTAHGLREPANRVSIPGHPATVAAMLDEPLATAPQKLALIDRFDRLSFVDLESRVNAACAFLTLRGVRPRHRVAATAANGADLVTAFIATQRLGAIWVGINRNCAPAEKRYFLEDSGASLYLADAQAREQTASTGIAQIGFEPGNDDSEWALGSLAHRRAERTPMPVDPWDPAAIAYTSGTTGRPKGAVHSQHNMMVAATLAQVMARDSVSDVVRGMTSPMTILNMMILGAIATLAKGDRLVCVDRTDARGVADWIRNERITTTTLVPTIVYDLLTRADIPAEDLTSLDWLVVGGAMVPEGLASVYNARFGKRMTTGYGQTEIPTAISRTNGETSTTQGAVGLPLPHLCVCIRDDQDANLPAGATGEICVGPAQAGPYRGVYTPTLGYWNHPEATEELLRNGWLHTGDMGHMTEVGELFIQDRRSDLIIRGGANIYPAEIERVLRQDDRVIDCAVIGLPDDRLGHSIAAVVETAGGVSDEEITASLRDRCADGLARYKNPAAWKIVPALPRNAAGKVLKRELATLFDG